MFSWNRYPLVRIAIPLIAGIIACSYCSIPVSAGGLLLVAVVFMLILILSGKHRTYQNRSLSGMLIFFAIMLLSICYTSVYVKSQQPPEELFQEENQAIIVSIAEPPVEKSKSVKLVVKINQFVHNDSLKPCSTKAMLYLAKDEKSKKLVYGDRLICYTRLSEPSSPKNPHEFNYKNYLFRKGIHLQAYLNAEVWDTMGKQEGFSIFRIANLMRNKFLDIFAAANMDTDELGVISAILLGCDDKLDSNLVQSYASTGVSHILCVSGMHVGIIYMILSFLLKFLDRNKRQRIVRSLILVSAIWLYACITGLFPSVMRAATMFTFVALAGMIGRNTNSYNSLLASLVFLLLLNPLLLFQVGFQFSYLAVFGIVWIQKPLKSLYDARTKVGNYVWDIISVSLAAQLLVSPLSLLYFHQFPNYFLLTNVAIISLAPFVVGGGIAVLLSSLWEFAYHWVSLALIYLIKIMNWIIVHIEAFPYSVTANIQISAGQVLLLYGVILTVFYAFLYKNKTALFLSIFFAISLSVTGIYKHNQTNSQKLLLFYHTKSGCIIDCIDGKTSALFGDSTAVSDAEIYNYNIKNNHIFHQIRNVETFQNQRFISFHGKTVFTLSEPLYPQRTNDKLNIDYLIIAHKNCSLEAIKDLFDFRLLIFDSKLPFYKSKQLKEFCQKENIPFHDLREDGAVCVELGK